MTISSDSEMEQKRQLRALWLAVITQAFDDAQATGNSKLVLKDKKEARAWLTCNSKDFRDACNLAEMDPDYIRKNAKIVIAKAEEENPTTESPRKSRSYHPKQIFVEHDGKRLNLRECADLAGASPQTVRRMLKNGYTMADVLNKYLYRTFKTPRKPRVLLHPVAKQRMIEHDGKSMTVSAWSRELDIPQSNLNKYILKGHTIADVLEIRSIKGTIKSIRDSVKSNDELEPVA